MECVAGQELFRQSQFPTKDITIVNTITVHHFNIPIAIKRAAHQALERFIRMIELRACFHIGRINNTTVNIGTPIYEATIRRIDIPLCGVVRPTVIPSGSGSIERCIPITWGLSVSVRICLSKIRVCGIGTLAPIFCRLRYRTDTVCILDTGTLTQHIRLLAIRTCDIDVYISDV